MAFPTTVDSITDEVPGVPGTVLHATQVLGPQRVTVGPTWFNVKSDQFGAVGDGVTDDLSAITSALTTASSSNGIVYFPPGNYTVSNQIVVPYGVDTRLCGRNTSFITALNTFPINTPVVRLGPAGSIGVGCRFRGGAVNCNNISGSTGIYSEGIQENSGIYESMVSNYGSFGVHINQPGSGAQPQNFTIDDLEVFSGPGTGAGAVGLALTATSTPIAGCRISRVTVFATGSTQLTTAIQLDAVDSAQLSSIHMENAVNGILIGSVAGCFALKIGPVLGNSNVTNTVIISNGSTSQNVLLETIFPNGATHSIVDQIASITLNSEQAVYAVGNGSAAQRTILSTDSGQGSRFKILTVSQSFSPSTPAGATQTGQVFQGSGVPSNANGNNGDVYFRTDTPGTVNQRIYVKSAGSWTGIV